MLKSFAFAYPEKTSLIAFIILSLLSKLALQQLSISLKWAFASTSIVYRYPHQLQFRPIGVAFWARTKMPFLYL